MRKKAQYRGFSLAEVLLAVGTLAIGMIFIGGTFLTGVYFSTLSTERTIAAAVADEAFAKIRLYGIDPASSSLATDRLVRFEALNPIADDEFAYPSTKTVGQKQYYWSALCRPVYSDATNRLVQVTVFISRKVGSAATYPPDGAIRPVPVQVSVSASGLGSQDRLTITTPGEETYINDGCTIADNRTGLLYRVLQRDADAPSVIRLDKLWYGQTTDSVWVIPPPIGGGKEPCIAVYQKLISF
ncbi:MAG: hypothetical protein A2Z25_05225 [Planctomycetes bacterium RBG_16_55_9]|nr:MAG: hypothetical protein A2Z25_05225 [Planctomycetes bacterium RBG_16_55_9]